MYGKSSYGLLQYAQDRSENTAPNQYFVDLSRYVPPFLAEILELAEIYRTEGYEIGQLWHEAEELLDQCFIATATWGLTLWEEMYNVTTNLSLSYEQRREILMAKTRGHGTTTKQMIEETAAAFSGGEVEVVEYNPENRFVIRFIGIKGIPRNMQAFVSSLEDIKPAHLAYGFEYTYTVWNSLDQLAWGDLGTKTWDDVRVMEGV